MSSESDQSNLRWLRRLAFRWAIGGLLLGIVWGLVQAFYRAVSTILSVGNWRD
jgi:hypothetical protein